MTHASLFSGIGGFDLAAEWMGWGNVFQVEIDPFCQKVLAKNFPEVTIYGDIKQFDGTKYTGKIDVLTGGFPCQPFSSSGKRKGTEDDRHLWPEMLRVIREIQPAYVVGENVYGLVNWSDGMVFEQVQTDLEAEGYEVAPVILPACAKDAPHRRDRIWFIAHSSSVRCNRKFYKWDRVQWQEQTCGEIRTGGFAITAHTKGQRCREARPSIDRSAKWDYRNGGKRITTNSHSTGGGEVHSSSTRSTDTHKWTSGSAFSRNRNEQPFQGFPAQSALCRRNDGISNRVDRIKSLGNAIVPQVAFEIFKCL